MPVTHTYAVDGAVGDAPGAVGPSELDPRAEWVPIRRPATLLDALEARLGSEVDLRKVLLAVLCPLRGALEGPPLEVLLARLPFPLPREIREGELNLNARLSTPASSGDYLVEVARLLQHAPRTAALYVWAVFAAARAVLASGEGEAIAARLPHDLGDLFRSAR